MSRALAFHWWSVHVQGDFVLLYTYHACVWVGVGVWEEISCGRVNWWVVGCGLCAVEYLLCIVILAILCSLVE